MSSAGTAEPVDAIAADSRSRGHRRTPGEAQTVIVGLGNPILGDDGVGWRVAEEIERRVRHGDAATDAVVERLCVGGLALMERLVGCAHAIVVDAFVSGSVPAGTVRSARLDELDTSHASHLDSAHDASLVVALEAGRALGAALPARVDVVAVEVANADEFGEALTPAVEGAVGRAADAVMAALTDEGVRIGGS